MYPIEKGPYLALNSCNEHNEHKSFPFKTSFSLKQSAVDHFGKALFSFPGGKYSVPERSVNRQLDCHCGPL